MQILGELAGDVVDLENLRDELAHVLGTERCERDGRARHLGRHPCCEPEHGGRRRRVFTTVGEDERDLLGQL